MLVRVVKRTLTLLYARSAELIRDWQKPLLALASDAHRVFLDNRRAAPAEQVCSTAPYYNLLCLSKPYTL